MPNVNGGFYLKARCAKGSFIAKAPPHVREIWDWLIMNANFKDNGKLKRGQVLTTYSEILDDLSWYVGYRKVAYKKHNCETAMKMLAKEKMITTAKTTRGMIITICNYDKYQDIKNYESRTETDIESDNETATKPHDKGTNDNECKEVNNLPDSANRDGAVDADAEIFYLSKKKKKLKGEVLKSFNLFWKAFAYPHGKAEAADAWLSVYSPGMVW